MHEFDIETLILSYAVDAVLPEIPQSVLDEHIPWHSGNDPDKRSSKPNIPFMQQICLSGSESEIKEPTPESHSSPADQLTNLPVVSSNLHDLPSITAANPLNLNQTASDNQTNLAREIVDDKASIIERRRVCKREYMRQLRRNPVYLERQRERQRERMRVLRKDPIYTERHKQRQRERYRNDPDFAERIRKRQRENQRKLYLAEHKRKYQKERQKERKKERYQNDPDFAERVRKRSREYKRKLRKKSGC
ncbi:hypothetical protein [Salinisphaera sp. G21_0]|uniref:hypothetical protein n=1 Tax=Salinisphaera sp. G21_0 TaxID=2821094 RepID=UPI001ADAD9DB|nr:hypothetical protein [Salinisphaera sp. G21_0]